MTNVNKTDVKDTESKFRVYAKGYVSEDKKQDEWYVNIYPIETLPNESGDLRANTEEQAQTTDVDGNKSDTTVKKGKNITARWLGLSQSGRVTPPNVCKGEEVYIYNFAGTDKYYWDTIATEFDRRKLEKIMWAINGTPKIGNTDFKNMYYFTMDTFNSMVRLHTSNANQEHCTYDLTFDTKNGITTLEDSKGNYIQLHSANNEVNIKTNAKVNTQTKDTNMNSSQNLTVSTGQATKMSSNTTNINSSSTTALKSSGCTITSNGIELYTTLMELCDALTSWLGTDDYKGSTVRNQGSFDSKVNSIKSKFSTMKG